MSQKPDYYTVLGLEKTATAAEIKTAYTKAALRNHPDRKKLPEEKAEAQVKLLQINEAYKVLSDANTRNVYDRFGHDGLAQAQSGNGGSGYEDHFKSSPIVKRTNTPEDAFAHFDSLADIKEPSPSVATPSVDRAAAAEQRRLARLARRDNPSSTSIVDQVAVPAPVADPIGRPSPPKEEKPVEKPANKSAHSVNFDAVARDAQTVQDSVGQLGRDAFVEVPLDTLTRFRDNVADMLTVLDAAIARKKQDGPRP